MARTLRLSFPPQRRSREDREPRELGVLTVVCAAPELRVCALKRCGGNDIREVGSSDSPLRHARKSAPDTFPAFGEGGLNG